MVMIKLTRETCLINILLISFLKHFFIYMLIFDKITLYFFIPQLFYVKM